MNNQSTRTRSLVEMALFTAIIIILSMTPLGYIPLPTGVNATTIHIPVIIAGAMLGWKKGAFTGFVFGMTSFLRSSFIAPSVTSFLFSPFYPGGNFFSLVICFIPRILIGVGAFAVFKLVYSLLKTGGAKKATAIAGAVAGFCGSLINTVLVMGGAYVFFAEKYAAALKIDKSAVLGAILAVVGGNGVPEAIVAAVLSSAICTALSVVLKNRN